MAKGKKPRQKKLSKVADRLLDKICQAVEELDVQLVTEVCKEKEVYYDNEDKPGKVTREVTHETKKITRVDVPVDRDGIRELASALKEVQALSREENEEAAGLQVILEGALEDYAR